MEMYSSDFESVIVFLIIYAVVFVVVGIPSLIAYILRGIAIMQMSKVRGLENGWLGFVPFINAYQLGTVAGEIEFGKKSIKNTGLWLFLTPIIVVTGALIIYIPFVIISFNTIASNNYGAAFFNSTALIVSTIFFILYMIIAKAFIVLIKGMVLYKIFRYYHTGQRPVFYMILSLFLPFAEHILLFINKNKPAVDNNTVTVSEYTPPPQWQQPFDGNNPPQ